jgi:hypothetical protein
VPRQGVVVEMVKGVEVTRWDFLIIVEATVWDF